VLPCKLVVDLLHDVVLNLSRLVICVSLIQLLACGQLVRCRLINCCCSKLQEAGIC
jgi:hypothetical protein